MWTGRRVQGATGAANLANDEHAHQPLAMNPGVLSSAGQRGLRWELATPVVKVHAGWSQKITRISSGNEKTQRGQQAASRIKNKNRKKLDKCFKSAKLLLLMMKKECVSEHIMIHLHYSTVNDGLKGLLCYKYDHNEVF